MHPIAPDTLAVLILAALLLQACASTSSNPPRPARINHVVFFKLKNPSDAPELIRDCDTKLATIPWPRAEYRGAELSD